MVDRFEIGGTPLGILDKLGEVDDGNSRKERSRKERMLVKDVGTRDDCVVPVGVA
jgi:hypothetical protein